MHIGYVVSLTQPGLIAWVYREMLGLEELGQQISVFPTKYEIGPHMPRPTWQTARWSLPRIVLGHVFWLIRAPGCWVAALTKAIKYRALIELALAGYFASEMRKHDVDRIHCHLGDRKLYVGYFCHLLCELPLSVTIHAHELYRNPNWSLFPVALNACDRIICIAELNRRILRDIWDIPDEKIRVVRLFGFSDLVQTDPVVILCVGRYEQKKGHDLLLSAVARLRAEHPDQDVEVWLAGGPKPGEKGIDVASLAQELQIEKYVIEFGELAQQPLRALYRKADFFCLLSRHQDGVPEGIPVVLMEAMSMSKAVIATEIGATAELVEDILIPEDNPDAAYEAIKQLVFDAGLRHSMGARNLEIIHDSYSPKNVARLLGALTGD